MPGAGGVSALGSAWCSEGCLVLGGVCSGECLVQGGAWCQGGVWVWGPFPGGLSAPGGEGGGIPAYTEADHPVNRILDTSY